MQSFNEFVKSIGSGSFSPDILNRAYDFAILSLADKKRSSGELFSDHCMRVAQTLKSYGITDPTTLAVAILHHSLSDGAATLDDLEKEFGKEISSMIGTLEQLRVIKFADSSDKQFAENLRKMFLSLAKDLRIVLIKLTDILDNLTTLKYLPAEKQTRIAKETLEIFAPLAERLGMGEVKGQMQDLAFEILYPDEFKKVKRILKVNLEELNKRLLKIKAALKQAIEAEGISFRLESRSKHIYSLYMKLKRVEIDFDISKIYDLIAFRVIVENTEGCYKVLGIIHRLWRPLPDRIKDYIANPKSNGYQSIHSTVFGPSGKPFEIQIRSEKMHQEAEYGIASHWHYSEVKAQGVSDADLEKGVSLNSDKLQWVKNLSKWQDEMTETEDFLKALKVDFFGERIFCFTPKGDVRDLPKGATPIDFAYSIHTDMGNLVIGAKVNNKVVKLETNLKNSDTVELLLSKDKSRKPNRDWLKFVATALAKRKIKKAYALG